MIKILALVVFFCTSTVLEVCCQTSQIMKGRILDAETNLPIKNITVYSSFDQDVTDDLGQYELNLRNCTDCSVGNRIFVSTYNSAYGFFEAHFGLAKDLRADIKIPRNPNLIGVIGIVRDVRTKKHIPGIRVRITSDVETRVENEMKTDEFGMYKFILRKELVGNIRYCTLIFNDENGRYMSKVETKNVAAFIETSLEPNEMPLIEIEINSYKKTNIKLYPGNIIKIKAAGNIKVGQLVGSTDPDGLSSGVAGFSLENYNIVRGIRHGALMYRISGESEWKFAGKALEFTAQQEGYLEFQVNDAEQENNSGAYTLKISMEK